jgi:ABC-type Fe3+/spermidine/putrescine transport system ATPase subunit
MVTASGLSKIFSDRKRRQVFALEQVSFEAQPGEVFGILGVNGAGKTTLLRVLGTILSPSAGDATVAGYNIRTQPQEVRQHIGYLTGSTALYGRLTAREILHYFGALYGLSREHLSLRIDELVETLRMHGFHRRAMRPPLHRSETACEHRPQYPPQPAGDVPGRTDGRAGCGNFAHHHAVHRRQPPQRAHYPLFHPYHE